MLIVSLFSVYSLLFSLHKSYDILQLWICTCQITFPFQLNLLLLRKAKGPFLFTLDSKFTSAPAFEWWPISLFCLNHLGLLLQKWRPSVLHLTFSHCRSHLNVTDVINIFMFHSLLQRNLVSKRKVFHFIDYKLIRLISSSTASLRLYIKTLK